MATTALVACGPHNCFRELLPAAHIVKTPSGGTHLYYAAPEGEKLRSTAGKLGWKVDTRAAGGYVVGAGSIVNGRTYATVRDAPWPRYRTA
ncbi:bifunctional DNA primase/polymerase [Streptomyces sp. NPDC093970]|uniref:bifunctional DNA primase/polymerase n=1 Tax=Streptomyces sp. NPDC093970 TaxID=3155076 RepID=UPI0034309D22